MLRSNIQIFGAEAMMIAFAKTTAEMATSMIASPYKYLIGCASNKPRDGPKPRSTTVDWKAKLREGRQ